MVWLLIRQLFKRHTNARPSLYTTTMKKNMATNTLYRYWQIGDCINIKKRRCGMTVNGTPLHKRPT